MVSSGVFDMVSVEGTEDDLILCELVMFSNGDVEVSKKTGDELESLG